MRRIRKPKTINADLDYIRFGYCDQCRGENTSIVIHLPPRGRSYSVCNRCSQQTWEAVGAANVSNWFTTGRLTKRVPVRNRGPREGKPSTTTRPSIKD